MSTLQPEKTEDDDADDASDDDVEKQLAREVTSLKAAKRASGGERFQVAYSGANNCIFIRTSLPRPDELVRRIFADALATRAARARFVLRMLPVIGTCRADVEKIGALCEEVLAPYFGEEAGGRSYSIVFKARNNSGVSRTAVFPVIGEVIGALNAENRVDLTSPQLVVCVDVLRTVCCVGVVSDFARFRKYNLQEVVQPAAAGAEEAGGGVKGKVGGSEVGSVRDEVKVGACSGEDAGRGGTEVTEGLGDQSVTDEIEQGAATGSASGRGETEEGDVGLGDQSVGEVKEGAGDGTKAARGGAEEGVVTGDQSVNVKQADADAAVEVGNMGTPTSMEDKVQTTDTL